MSLTLISPMQVLYYLVLSSKTRRLLVLSSSLCRKEHGNTLAVLHSKALQRGQEFAPYEIRVLSCSSNRMYESE